MQISNQAPKQIAADLLSNQVDQKHYGEAQDGFFTQWLHLRLVQAQTLINIFLNQNRSVSETFSTQVHTIDAPDNAQFVLNNQEKRKNQVRTVSVNPWLTQVRSLIYSAKIALLKTVKRNFPEPMAGLIGGMVFGGGETVPTEIQAQLKIIGMQHVISASGYNVALMIGLSQTLFSRFSRFKRAGLSISLVLSYAVMADLTPSILRATSMAILSLIGTQMGFRQYRASWALALTVMGMICFDLSYLTSISFQLSIAATVGIMVFVPLFTSQPLARSAGELGQLKPVQPQRSWLAAGFAPFKEAAIVSGAAQVLALPVVWHHFGEVSGLSLLSNTLLLWLTPLITLGGVWFILLAVPLIALPQISQLILPLFAFCLLVLTHLFLWGVAGLAQFTWLFWTLPPLSWTQVAIWWTASLGGAVWWQKRRDRHFRVKNAGFNFYGLEGNGFG